MNSKLLYACIIKWKLSIKIKTKRDSNSIKVWFYQTFLFSANDAKHTLGSLARGFSISKANILFNRNVLN